MSYVVLARKWRPMTFSDLIGQDHVSETLGNAIKSGRIAHAFLFTGVRGVGKTTSARIMAKALNCLASDGPTKTPCLECAACKEIAEGKDVDVQEIDGASYNGVDEVRRLQESLPYRPNRDRYKIFIVDEVHMLSQSAWNAFLKTLEEPPPHVKFIFATTEVHKVPVTILSRVQRFDFKLIPTRLLMDRLRYVLEQERVAAEEAALAILAREAAGSMRDAMSLLDQVIAWSDETLTETGVASVLGVASRKVLYDLTAELIAGRPGPPLQLIAQLANQGFDTNHVARDLLMVLRDVVVTATSDAADQLVDLPEGERADVARLAQHDVDDLLRLHQGFSQGYDDVVRSAQPRAALEMLLVRLARRPPLVPIDDLIERLIRLEKRLHSGGRAPSGGGDGSRSRDGAGAGTRTPDRGARALSQQASAQQASAQQASAQSEPSHVTQRTGGGRPAPRAASNEPAPPAERPPPASTASSTAPPPNSAPPNSAPPNSAPPNSAPPNSAPPTLSTQPAAPGAVRPPTPSSTPPRSAPATSTADSPAPSTPPQRRETSAAHSTAAAQSANGSSVRPPPASNPTKLPLDGNAVEAWRAVVEPLRATDPKLGAFLDHAEVIAADAQSVSIRYQPGSMVDLALKEPGIVKRIEDSARALFGGQPAFVAEVVQGPQSGNSVFAVDKQARQTEQREAITQARNHPMVQEAVRVLGARIKNIELPKN